MGKKLISLGLVLALAGAASAIQWVGPLGGHWDVPGNWDLGRVPISSDSTTKLQPSTGLPSHIIIDTDADAGVKLQITSFANTLVTLEITNTGRLRHSGSFDGYTGSLDATIDAGGVWNACTSSGSFKMASNTASGIANSVAVDVYGTLNVKGTSSSILALVNDTRAGTSGTNSATINIREGGLVDVDSYTIGVGGVQYGTGRINIYGGGTFKIKGDVSSQVTADIAAGRIVSMAGGELSIDTTGVPGYTLVIGAPEPATLALLGLGGLLMRRRRN